MSTEREALVGMIALWERMFDPEHRCFCRDAQYGPVAQGTIEKGVFTRTGPPVMVDSPPTVCAYCTAKKALDHGRLAMDEQLVGRT